MRQQSVSMSPQTSSSVFGRLSLLDRFLPLWILEQW